MSVKSCVYSIYNTFTGHSYVGSTSNYTSRVWLHKDALRKKRHHSKLLQDAWNTYGEKAFIFQVVEPVPVDQLTEREQYYMGIIDTTYNVLPNAGSSLGWSRRNGHTEDY